MFLPILRQNTNFWINPKPAGEHRKAPARDASVRTCIAR
jgi:hypothetical protein